MFKEKLVIYREGGDAGAESAEPQKSLSKAEVDKKMADMGKKYAALEKEINTNTSWETKDLETYGVKIATYLNTVRSSLSVDYYPQDQFELSRLNLVRTLHAAYKKAGKEDPRLTLAAWPGETLAKEIDSIPAEEWTDQKVVEYWDVKTGGGKITGALAPYEAVEGVVDVAFELLRKILAKINDHSEFNGQKVYKSKVSDEMRTTLGRKARGIPVVYEIPWEIKPVIDIKLAFDKLLSEVKEWNDAEVKRIIDLIENGDDNNPGYAEQMVLASFSSTSDALEKGNDPKQSPLFRGRLRTSKTTLYQKLYDKLIYQPNVDPKLAEQIFKGAEVDTRATVANEAMESLLDEDPETIPSTNLGKLSQEIVDGLTTVVGNESAEGTATLLGNFDHGYQNFAKLIDAGGKPLSFYTEQAEALRRMADSLDEKLKKFEFESVTRVLDADQKKAYAELKQVVDKVKIFERAAANAVILRAVIDDYEEYLTSDGQFYNMSNYGKARRLKLLHSRLQAIDVVPSALSPKLLEYREKLNDELQLFMAYLLEAKDEEVKVDDGKPKKKSPDDELEDIFTSLDGSRLLFEEVKAERGSEKLSIRPYPKQRRELQKIELLSYIADAAKVNLQNSNTYGEYFKQMFEREGITHARNLRISGIKSTLLRAQKAVMEQYSTNPDGSFDLNKYLDTASGFREDFVYLFTADDNNTQVRDDLEKPIQDILDGKIESDADVERAAISVVKFCRSINVFEPARQIVTLVLKDEFESAISKLEQDNPARVRELRAEARKEASWAVYGRAGLRNDIRHQFLDAHPELNSDPDSLDRAVAMAMDTTKEMMEEDMFEKMMSVEASKSDYFKSSLKGDKATLFDEFLDSAGTSGKWYDVKDETRQFWTDFLIQELPFAIISVLTGVGTAGLVAKVGSKLSKIKTIATLLKGSKALRILANVTRVGARSLSAGTAFAAMHYQLKRKFGEQDFNELPDWGRRSLASAAMWGLFEGAMTVGSFLKAGKSGKELLKFKLGTGADDIAKQQVDELMKAAGQAGKAESPMFGRILEASQKGSDELAGTLKTMQGEGLAAEQASAIQAAFKKSPEALDDALRVAGVEAKVAEAIKAAALKGPAEFAKAVKGLRFMRLDPAIARILEGGFADAFALQKGWFNSAKIFKNSPKAKAFYEYLVLNWHLEAAAMFVSDFIHRGVVDKDAKSFFYQDFADLMFKTYTTAAIFRGTFKGIEVAKGAVSGKDSGPGSPGGPRPRPILDRVIPKRLRDGWERDFSYPEGTKRNGEEVGGEFMGRDGFREWCKANPEDAMARIKRSKDVPLGVEEVLDIAEFYRTKHSPEVAQEFLANVLARWPRLARARFVRLLNTRKGPDALNISPKLRRLLSTPELMNALEGKEAGFRPTSEEVANQGKQGPSLLEWIRILSGRESGYARNPAKASEAEAPAGTPTPARVKALEALAKTVGRFGNRPTVKWAQRVALLTVLLGPVGARAEGRAAESAPRTATAAEVAEIGITKDVLDGSTKGWAEKRFAISRVSKGVDERPFNDYDIVESGDANAKFAKLMDISQDSMTDYALQLYGKKGVDKVDLVEAFAFYEGNNHPNKVASFDAGMETTGWPAPLKQYAEANALTRLFIPEAYRDNVRVTITPEGEVAMIVDKGSLSEEDFQRVIETAKTIGQMEPDVWQYVWFENFFDHLADWMKHDEMNFINNIYIWSKLTGGPVNPSNFPAHTAAVLFALSAMYAVWRRRKNESRETVARNEQRLFVKNLREATDKGINPDLNDAMTLLDAGSKDFGNLSQSEQIHLGKYEMAEAKTSKAKSELDFLEARELALKEVARRSSLKTEDALDILSDAESLLTKKTAEIATAKADLLERIRERDEVQAELNTANAAGSTAVEIGAISKRLNTAKGKATKAGTKLKQEIKDAANEMMSEMSPELVTARAESLAATKVFDKVKADIAKETRKGEITDVVEGLIKARETRVQIAREALREAESELSTASAQAEVARARNEGLSSETANFESDVRIARNALTLKQADIRLVELKIARNKAKAEQDAAETESTAARGRFAKAKAAAKLALKKRTFEKAEKAYEKARKDSGRDDAAVPDKAADLATLRGEEAPLKAALETAEGALSTHYGERKVSQSEYDLADIHVKQVDQSIVSARENATRLEDQKFSELSGELTKFRRELFKRIDVAENPVKFLNKLIKDWSEALDKFAEVEPGEIRWRVAKNKLVKNARRVIKKLGDFLGSIKEDIRYERFKAAEKKILENRPKISEYLVLQAEKLKLGAKRAGLESDIAALKKGSLAERVAGARTPARLRRTLTEGEQIEMRSLLQELTGVEKAEGRVDAKIGSEYSDIDGIMRKYEAEAKSFNTFIKGKIDELTKQFNSYHNDGALRDFLRLVTLDRKSSPDGWKVLRNHFIFALFVGGFGAFASMFEDKSFSDAEIEARDPSKKPAAEPGAGDTEDPDAPAQPVAPVQPEAPTEPVVPGEGPPLQGAPQVQPVAPAPTGAEPAKPDTGRNIFDALDNPQSGKPAVGGTGRVIIPADEDDMVE